MKSEIKSPEEVKYEHFSQNFFSSSSGDYEDMNNSF